MPVKVCTRIYRIRQLNCRPCLDRHICNGRTGLAKVSLEPHDSKKDFDMPRAKMSIQTGRQFNWLTLYTHLRKSVCLDCDSKKRKTWTQLRKS